MKYVIDASTAFQWEVPEPDSLKAIRLREDDRNGARGDRLRPIPGNRIYAYIFDERVDVAGTTGVAVFMLDARAHVLSAPPVLCYA